MIAPVNVLAWVKVMVFVPVTVKSEVPATDRAALWVMSPPAERVKFATSVVNAELMVIAAPALTTS